MLAHKTPMRKGILEKRYKRFFADVILDDGTRVTAHCPNTGSMATCMSPGATVWLSYNDNPNRKLKWTWELTQTTGGYIGVNTAVPNRAVEAAILNGRITEFLGYQEVLREVKYGENSRIDLLLRAAGKRDCYIEIKNTTLLHENDIQFPDAVTERGQKHLRELTSMAQSGHRAVIFFFVNRPDGHAFRPADHIDPVYGRLLREVSRQGVEILAYRALHSLEAIEIGPRLPINLHH